MILCPCKFESSAAPESAEWHRGHREHHLRVYPAVDADTKLALDKMVEFAEGGRIAMVPEVRFVTAETITDEQILALQNDPLSLASPSLPYSLAYICEVALRGNHYHTEARSICAKHWNARLRGAA